MSPLADRPFLKMNGLGNEIVVLDLRGTDLTVSAQEARAVGADPRLVFDQMMVIHDPRTPGTDAYVRILNIDGSEAQACGNGTRCVAWAMLRDQARDDLLLETRRGVLEARRLSPLTFSVDMGTPQLGWREFPTRDAFEDTRAVDVVFRPEGAPALEAPGLVNMGNPHVVFFVEEPDAYDLETVGPPLENDPQFPERANIEFAKVEAPDHIRLRVWERGAGITQACGSGACAALVAAARRGLTGRKATVSLPGGDLLIEWRDDDHVVMTGPVELEFEERFSPALFAERAG
jgi:diaminopimelate epimerase